MNQKLLVSCVAEHWFKHNFRVKTLFETLKAFGGELNNATMVANFVHSVDKNVEKDLLSLGVKVNIVQPFDLRQRTCNKIRMLEVQEDYDVLIALDSDVAIVRDFSNLISTTELQSYPHPLMPYSLPEWEFIYSSFGLTIPKEENRIHYNTGVLIIPKNLVKKLRKTWGKYCHLLLDHYSHNPQWAHIAQHPWYTDQVALSLAVVELGINVSPLPQEMNFGTQFIHDPYDNDMHPYIIHYHDEVDEKTWTLLKSNCEVPNQYIDKVNVLLKNK